MQLSERELATVLAALRLLLEADEKRVAAMPHFDGGLVPLSEDQIDNLCERLNMAADDLAMAAVPRGDHEAEMTSRGF